MSSAPHFEYWHELKVEFVETDMAGIVHFSNYFRYMEAAEHAFFDSLGLSMHRAAGEGGENGEQGMTGWARVHAECDYAQPLFYRDRLRIHVLVSGRSNSTLSYRFTFHRRAPDAGQDASYEPVARGAFTVAHVGRDSATGTMRARRMPEAVASMIHVAPPERLNENNEKG